MNFLRTSSSYRVLGLVLLTLCGGALGHADLIPTLTGSPVASGGNYAYDYDINLGAAGRQDPTETAGEDPAGTFVTIYDIAGFVSASASDPDWTVSTQLLGATPSSITASDDASLMNVTFTYNGPTIFGPYTTPGFEIISSLGGEADGSYSSQATFNFVGRPFDADPVNFQTDQEMGDVIVPAATFEVEEPASAMLLGMGLLCLMIGKLRVETAAKSATRGL
ncbi:MAG TPA: hypothetical protein VH088_07960 [Terriglobales bacterium]|nr:hypothetical protein [Terriglobales bacterium]